jgi:hypothetical protein
MNAQPRKNTGQGLFGSVLILLAVLGTILLFKWLGHGPPGKSRIGWPAPATHTKP